MRDVIVVGAGPAGVAVAKRCAGYGLNTLILEKRRLPRDKVCSGMIMGPLAHILIKQEFGDMPESVLSNPSSLSGYMFHVPGIGSQKIDNFTLLGWRRDQDYWMAQKAQAKGAEIWQGARVIGVRQKEPGFSVEIERDKERQELEARFVVGADGMNSLVRRFLFPELKVNYRQIYQEGYRGEVDLDRKYFHWFYTMEYSSTFLSVHRKPSFFSLHQKDNTIIINVNAEIGQAKQFMGRAKDFLAKNYRFDTSQKPVWRDGCLGLNLYEELISHTFLPAKGNALWVGDAASFHLPVSGEGIGTAIKSGLLAADSIREALGSGKQADRIYLTEVEAIISEFKELYPWYARIVEETKSGGNSLPEVLREAYHSTLRMF